jgi:hypothetical protein
MESIECCLDNLLNKLNANWNIEERLPLDGMEFLKEIEYPSRIEYFIELMDILKGDGYVKLVDSKDSFENEIKWYEQSAIITVKGILFLNRGGYQQKILEDAAYNRRLEIMEAKIARATIWIAIATVILAIGGLIAAWYYLNEIFYR